MNTINKPILLFIIGLFLLSYLSLTPFKDNWNKQKESNESGWTPMTLNSHSNEQDTITIAVVGDLMCHSTQFNDAKTATSYDFNKAFLAVKPYLSSADLCFGNLETVTAGAEKEYTGYPMFNTPVEFLDAMKAAGFDVATNANNHSLDRKFLGVERTIDSLDAREIKHTGTFKQAADTASTLIVSAKGIKIAVLAYTYGTNGISFNPGKEYSVALIDSNRIIRDVYRAKSTGADAIVACMHWGNEYERLPNNYEKNYAGLLSSLGVNLIFGSHPHVLQPCEIKKNELASSFIVYSLGNFFSGQRKPYTDYGMILRIQLIKNKTNGKITTGKLDYIPTYVSTKNGFRIIPVADAIQANENNDTNHPAYSPMDMPRLKEIWPEINKHISNPSIGLAPYQP